MQPKHACIKPEIINNMGLNWKFALRLDTNITKNRPNMFPEIPDLFFQISQKYLALFHKFYSKTQKNSRSFEIATQISAILLNISHMAYIINGGY